MQLTPFSGIFFRPTLVPGCAPGRYYAAVGASMRVNGWAEPPPGSLIEAVLDMSVKINGRWYSIPAQTLRTFSR